MERASRVFVNGFLAEFDITQPVSVVCGKGNNGGDGLAIARMLHQEGFDVRVLIIEHSDKASPDFTANLNRLAGYINPVHLKNSADLQPITESRGVLVDALFGSGLARPLTGLAAEVCTVINALDILVVSVDVPSGLFMDSTNAVNDKIIRADLTFTFETPPLSFMWPCNESFTGRWRILKIGLSRDFMEKVHTSHYFTEEVGSLEKPRLKFSNKGTFGSALLVAGSYGMMGAAILAAKACMRSGAGKLRVRVPGAGNDILQVAVPEVMSWSDNEENLIGKNWSKEDLEAFDAVGIGPGTGTSEHFADSLLSLFKSRPRELVVDADALNLLNSGYGKQIGLMEALPHGAVLTPHPREFERMLGKVWKNDEEKISWLREFAESRQVVVCLKGHYTAVAWPDGTVHFNSTGNAGMATAGSGDVLTGMILAFLAQGYSPEQAAVLGVFEHGAAGDRAVRVRSERALIAGDIIDYIR